MAKRFTLSAILAFVVALLMPYAASAADVAAAADVVTARVAAEQQLVSLGINPGDAVFQVGSRNYAGPNCPGSDWNCTTAATVVQIGSGTAISATNTFACNANPMTPGVVTSSSGSCTIVQSNTTGNSGTNDARCIQWTSTNPATQTCNITQTNVNGKNRAFVAQVIFQSQPQGEQDANQYATVHQTNGPGANESAIAQTIGQKESKRVAGATAATQTQEAHQFIEVCQGGVGPCFAPSNGTNKSGVAQNNVQRASVQFDSGAEGIITQNQNAEFQGPKSSAEVHQNTTDKTNDAALLQFSRQTGTVHNRRTDNDDDDDDDYHSSATTGFNGVVNQQQGHSESCSADGLCGFEFQTSTGVQRAFERQDEVQRLVAPPGADQTQYGPVFCCATQTGGNSASVNRVSQSKAQFHTSSATHGFMQGHCNSPSTDTANNNCSVTQTLTQSGRPVPATNSCTESPCNIVISCEQGEGSPPCATFGGAEGTPDPPCFPPSSCGIDLTMISPLLRDVGALTG